MVCGSRRVWATLSPTPTPTLEEPAVCILAPFMTPAQPRFHITEESTRIELLLSPKDEWRRMRPVGLVGGELAVLLSHSMGLL